MHQRQDLDALIIDRRQPRKIGACCTVRIGQSSQMGEFKAKGTLSHLEPLKVRPARQIYRDRRKDRSTIKDTVRTSTGGEVTSDPFLSTDIHVPRRRKLPGQALPEIAPHIVKITRARDRSRIRDTDGKVRMEVLVFLVSVPLAMMTHDSIYTSRPEGRSREVRS